MDVILWYDRVLFYLINVSLVNKPFDIIMPFITERNNWFLLYIYFWFYLVIKGGKEGRVAAILVILAVASSDQISSSILKPLVERLRPCHELEGVRNLVDCGGKYGFPSSHAANYFAATTILSAFYRQYKWIFIIIAIFVSYSRVYVGVHYPIDVISGALLGFICGIVLIILYKLLNKLISNNFSNTHHIKPTNEKQ